MSEIKILVVDDLPDNTFLLSGLLTENGYEPIIANSGAECLQFLENEEKPALILMDIMMPEMTGIEALVKIQENPEFKYIPVIMVSAKTNSEDVEEALSKGAVDYVKKPIDEIEMLARIKTALRLKESEDKMREMVKAQESFIRLISHDLRSPFTSIHGFAELLLMDDNLEENQKNSLQFIIDSTNQSLEYFNKLLDWTRMGASEIELNRNNVQVSKVMEYTKALFITKAKEKDITIELDTLDSITINADEVYLSQVISNLVNNAIKFTPNGGVIKLISGEHDGVAVLKVRDSGIGMPADMTVDTVFSQSINKSRKGTDGEKGTGIGLTICKKIIDAHNFRIDFNSELNKYTEFSIYCG